MVKSKNINVELFIASERCDFEGLERILKTGVNPSNIPDANGYTALRRVLRLGDIKCVRILLEYGGKLRII